MNGDSNDRIHERARVLARRERWATVAALASFAVGAALGPLAVTVAIAGGVALLAWARRLRTAADAARARVALTALTANGAGAHPYRGEAEAASAHAAEAANAADAAPDAAHAVAADASPLAARGRPSGDVPLAARAAATIGLLVAGVVALSFCSGDASPRRRWLFVDDATPDALGLVARVGAAGRWSLEPDRHATGGKAMVNHEGDPRSRPGILVVADSRARDVRLVTRCRGGSCGVAFRVVDDETYTAARVDLDGGRVELVRVASGAERVLGSAPYDVPADGWHELAVEARGESVRVAANGRDVLDVQVGASPAIGAVGLWAPAAARAHFDELVLEQLAPVPALVELLPLFGRRTS